MTGSAGSYSTALPTTSSGADAHSVSHNMKRRLQGSLTMANTGNYILTKQIVEKFDLANPDVWPDFETPALLERRRDEIIHVLKTHDFDEGKWRGTRYETALAKLIACKKGRGDCLTPICPVCMSRFRRWFVSHGLAASENEKGLLFVTWVPEPKYPPTLEFFPSDFEAMFQQRLRRAVSADHIGSVKIWGYMEIKLEPKTKCLVPHIHFIAANCDEHYLRALGGGEYDPRKKRWKYPKDRMVHRPIEITPIKEEDRVALLSYCCKTYHRGARSYPPGTLTAKDNSKRKAMAQKMGKIFTRRRTCALSTAGYLKLISARRAMPKHSIPVAEFYNVLAGLSVHEMVVLRGMTRKGVDRDSIDWPNASHLESKRRKRPRPVGFEAVN